MKRYIIIAISVIVSAAVSGQTLQNIYRQGPVKLQPSTAYASGNNWNELFADYGMNLYGKEVGKIKDMTMADDGSVFVSNRSSWNIYKFGPDGRFVKAFGREGTGDGEFRARPALGGGLDNRYVIVTEHNGRINLFDTNGDWDRLLCVDYMPLTCVPLRDGKFALWAHVPYKGGVRYLIVIIDIDTSEQQVVSSRYVSTEELRHLTLRKEKCLISISDPFCKLEAVIARTPDGNLVAGWNDSREIQVFSPRGSLLTSFELSTTPPRITDEMRHEFARGAERMIDSLEAIADKAAALEKLRGPEFFPEYMPYFYNLMVDSDGNLLVFVYTEEEPTIAFQVYSLSPAGRYVTTSSLECDDYVLGLRSRNREVAFRNGKLYGILPLAGEPGIPLRLVEFGLTN